MSDLTISLDDDGQLRLVANGKIFWLSTTQQLQLFYYFQENFPEIEAPENEKQYPHYFKRLPDGTTHIDVYLILDLFNVVNQAVGHAIKKLLCPGQRHQKSYLQDIKEARNTLNRVIEIEELKQKSSTPSLGILKD